MQFIASPLRSAVLHVRTKREEPQMQPIQARLSGDHTVLALTWPDGTTSRLDAAGLRHASRAASEIRREAEGRRLVVEHGLTVASIEPIGNYALRLSFSDGHDRGIYPWGYLRELADGQAA